MKIPVLLIILFSFSVFIQCNNPPSKKEATAAANGENRSIPVQTAYSAKGYALMKQKCFICHLPTPDPARRNQMIAPPMVRVQEHYKPAFPNRKAFVEAIVNFVKNPTKEKTLMPGAVSRFKLMPKLMYNDDELRLIAETLYAIDFKSPAKANRMMTGTLKLNNGQKWKLHSGTLKKIKNTVLELNGLKTNRIEDYHRLGKDIFNTTKSIILDTSYPSDVHQQLQLFFHGIEDDMHALMAVQTVNEAQKEVKILKEKFKSFYNYFE